MIFARCSAGCTRPEPGSCSCLRGRILGQGRRYIPHLPAGGGAVLFDRSWYGGAAVHGMLFRRRYGKFVRTCPAFERSLVETGIRLLKH
ncbi:hypothetical protein J057_24430 [Marinobacter nanhaiticus D15-8W]|uniref:Polyphosphate kinase-2-related domain-containing protein n=1 Tax=Marinobacter nanhaiticus D15-8W TaxID=626887 RepID=A0A371CG59_9GAMM|nr:hypothetical protein J057_24430 [Marinobacter nanhaiticus D15-8W]